MRCLISIALLLMLGGCADFGYYWHNARGHLAVMNQRSDIDSLLADGKLQQDLRQRLQLVQEIRDFSVERLRLPANDSYTSYVELDRPYVTQNMFAAPEFSTRLHQWCYPIIGCASYRGYFDEQRLQDYAGQMREQGFEVHIGKVSAYSTLGWFDDPVLSSFIEWPDYRLAGLIFHELTHQVIYVDDDTTFNESLASAVQQVGTELWLQSRQQSDQLDRLARWSIYRSEVMQLIGTTREQLARLYELEVEAEQKRLRKQRIFDEARKAHSEIASRHGITAGFTHWFSERMNNAKIGSVAAYHSRVPAFVNMIRAKEMDFTAFFEYVEKLAELDRAARDRCLEFWENSPESGSVDCPTNPATS